MFILAEKCSDPANWQIENSNVAFCDLHRQQMQFVKFIPIDGEHFASNCALNSSHGLACKFCNQCKKPLCIECAIDHAIHGVVDIEMARKQIACQIDEKLVVLQEQSKNFQPIGEEIRKRIPVMQTLCILLLVLTYSTTPC